MITFKYTFNLKKGVVQPQSALNISITINIVKYLYFLKQ